MNKQFNKNLIMSDEEEHLKSNSCWICKKVIDNDEEKARDLCYVTGKFRDVAHRNCNINFQLTKNVPIIFHNLRGYDGHLIFNELDKCDVFLLTDVFRKFIDTCLKYYGVDPCHYFSSPGLSWDAILKMTDIRSEKISDIDKYLFIEKGSRRVISYIAKRYAKANNKYMNDYDPKNSQHLYLDMNNSYGWAMSEYLPYKGFKWLKNVDEFDAMSINEKSPIGYLLEVDL